MKKMKTIILTLCAGIVMAGCSNLAKGTTSVLLLVLVLVL